MSIIPPIWESPCAPKLGSVWGRAGVLLIILFFKSMEQVLSVTTVTHERHHAMSLGRPSRHREASDFLMATMPLSDRQDPLVLAQLDTHIRTTLAARYAHEWSKRVPWDVFLAYVLPYATLTECRDMMRQEFANRLGPLVSSVGSTWEAVALLNEHVWTLMARERGSIVFKADQTPEIMCPSQVVEHMYASCTGLSLFLVEAARSVGVPARVVGTMEWDDGRGGNHSWVEVWVEGLWWFVGADEPIGKNGMTPNHSWFFPAPVVCQHPGSFEHGIYASSWLPTEHGTRFPLSWAPEDDSVHALDVTQRYIDQAQMEFPNATCNYHEQQRPEG